MFPHILRKHNEQKDPGRIPDLDKVAYAIGVATSVFNLPQIYKIWIGRNAEGVSLVAWIGFAAASLFWLSYSYIHKEKALTTTFVLTLIFQLVIIAGVIAYS